jgi:tetratricopeptide (TPR) repeat protein
MRELDWPACRALCFDELARADERDERLRWLNNLSVVEYHSGLLTTALSICRASYVLASNSSDHFLKGNHHLSYAATLAGLGQTDEAFLEYEAALYHYEQCEREDLTASVLNNVGCLYVEVGDFGKALEYLERAREKYARLNDWNHLADVYDSLSKACRAKAGRGQE